MFLERILRVHCQIVLVAEAIPEALDLARAADVSLVLADARVATAGDFQLLRGLRAPTSAVLFPSRDLGAAQRRRAEQLGAIGFLDPPIRVRDILSIWERATTFTPGRACARLQIDVAAVLRIPEADGSPVLAGSTHDLGLHGVFVVTEGPIPVGTRVVVELSPCGADPIVGSGRVIRVQEPGWLHRGGVAIQFDPPDARLREQLLLVLDQAGAELSRAPAAAR
jgi:hypothetical protein